MESCAIQITINDNELKWNLNEYEISGRVTYEKSDGIELVMH